MSNRLKDFLLADWEPDGVNVWVRYDGVRLRFDVIDDEQTVTCNYRETFHKAGIRDRERDGAAILIPTSTDPEVIADALWFWPRHPSIHLAALALREHVIWPKETP